MTIGDVLATVAVLAAIGVGWAATLLLAALAFSEKTRRAGEAIAAAPGRCLGRGLGVFVVTALVAGTLTHAPAGPVRLVGFAVWAGMALVVAIGSAGIARLLGERIQGIGTPMAPFASLTRGTALYVMAGYLPIVGWFLIAPLALLISLGGAFTALRTPRQAAQPLSAPASPELGAGGIA